MARNQAAVMKRLEASTVSDLCGSEIAEILEFRMSRTNAAEFMTPTLLARIASMCVAELKIRAVHPFGRK